VLQPRLFLPSAIAAGHAHGAQRIRLGAALLPCPRHQCWRTHECAASVVCLPPAACPCACLVTTITKSKISQKRHLTEATPHGKRCAQVQALATQATLMERNGHALDMRAQMFWARGPPAHLRVLPRRLLEALCPHAQALWLRAPRRRRWRTPGPPRWRRRCGGV